MLTCYDYATARLMEEAGVDSLLVGDTYAEVCRGHPTTLPMTMEHLVTIAEGVRRGSPTCYLVGDMSYLSYQVCPHEAISNAGLFMANAGCDCVKVEVDRRLVNIVEAMATASEKPLSWPNMSNSYPITPTVRASAKEDECEEEYSGSGTPASRKRAERRQTNDRGVIGFS